MIRHRSLVTRLLAGLVLATGCFYSTPATAQDLASQVPSLKWVPANAGTYSAMLRNREQLEIVLNSNAVAKLMAMPGMQMAKKAFDQEWAEPSGKLGWMSLPLAEFRKWYDQKANAELVEILKDLVSDEIFTYSDKNVAEFSDLLQEVNQSSQLARVAQLVRDGPLALQGDPLFQVRSMLLHLNDNAARLKFPDFVVGFKITRSKPAQVAKLIDGALKQAAQMAPPPLQGRFKKTTIHDADVHTITLDGSMVPWDQVPFEKIEEAPGQLEKLRKRLKEMKITFAVSVRDNYLLLSLGEGTAGLQALGAPGKKLIDRPEFAPLAKFGDRRLTSVAYTSKEFMTVGTEVNVEDTVKWVDSVLKDSNLTPLQQAKISKDFKSLMVDVRRYMPQPGAQLDFTFLNHRGIEGYHYNWTKNHGLDGTKPLTILENIGGQPIGFFASRSPSQMAGYKDFVKYVQLAHGYFEEYALPEMPRKEKAIYTKFMNDAMPLFTRLDKATGEKLLPSMDGQGAWVLDGKLKLKLPQIKKAMPVPELAVVAGLTDVAQFREAMTEYRDVFNGLVDIVTKMAPPGENVPDFRIPEPKVKAKDKKNPGTLYSWPLPKVSGLDPKLLPTAGLTDKIVVFAASQEHAQRLLKKTPFKMDGGPLGNTKKALASAAYFSWAGLVDAASPWIDYALAEGHPPEDVVAQVHTVVEILKVFRTYTSVVYVEKGAVVTHSESVFRDLDK